MVSIMVMVFFLFSAARTQAIGIGPGKIIIENILPDSEAGAEFFISRADPKTDDIMDVQVIGETASAIALEEKNPFILPVGMSQVPFRVRVRTNGLVPGQYEAVVRLTPQHPVDVSGVAGSEIIIAVQGVIQFSVTDQKISSFQLNNFIIEQSDVREGQNFQMKYHIVNTGNVPTRPTKLVINVYDRFNNSVLYSNTYNAEELPLIQPFTENFLPLTTKFQPKNDYYTVEILAYDGEKIVFQDTHPLQILRSEDAGKAETGGEKSLARFLMFAALAIIVAILGIIFWKLFRPKHEN